ncbi:MAG: sigma-70 family RNA polymerase sigma factor [Bacteroidetes bacterium]|nr:sigma-70 family RNA polymerase sigma factor [Bacteroidota bacterium]
METHLSISDSYSLPAKDRAENAEWTEIQRAMEQLEAFEPLYYRYYSRIYEFVQRRIANTDDCGDITSIVFEKAMKNLPKYKAQGLPFGNWLFRIAWSEVGNYYRQQQKNRKVWVQSEGLLEIATELEDTAEENNESKRVLKTLEALEPEEMELIVMRYFEKRSYAELAQIVGINESTLRVRIHRTIEKLRKQLLRK